MPDESSPERPRNGSRQSWEGGFLWKAVSHERVIEFLTRYQTHSAARKVNGDLLAEFIGSMAEIGELTSWTVVLIAGDGKKIRITDRLEINMLKRARKGEHPDRHSIGRLLSPAMKPLISMRRRGWRHWRRPNTASGQIRAGSMRTGNFPKYPVARRSAKSGDSGLKVYQRIPNAGC